MDTLNIYYDKIGSTNSEAKNILLKHNIKKAVIIADEQTSGKGRYCLLYTSPSPRDS